MTTMTTKKTDAVPVRAPRNKTLTCSPQERQRLEPYILRLQEPVSSPDQLDGRVIGQDFFDAVEFLPDRFIDLLVVDPPYNLTKDYHGNVFRSTDGQTYQQWFRHFLEQISRCLTPSATVYVCSDWRTSALIYPVLEDFFCVRNRITWEREKGRGAQSNWKNNTEDIWFCTCGDEYYFDVASVKLKRRVLAPYRTDKGQPKDWTETQSGQFRLTHPSNIWTDISIPFWSMPENTDHPTQKPEKLIAKLILASSPSNAFVFDPFLGSGTTAVTAKKLGRRFAGIELNDEYCCWALKRLEMAELNPEIQGYLDGVFWERNSTPNQKNSSEVSAKNSEELSVNNSEESF